MPCAYSDHERGFHAEKRGKCLTAGCGCAAFCAAGEGGIEYMVFPEPTPPRGGGRLAHAIGQLIGRYRRKVAG